MEIVDTDRLYDQRKRVQEIRNLQSEIDIISSKLSSPGSVKLTDMPKSQTPYDKVGALISRKIQKENKLNKLLSVASSEGAILEEVIDSISTLPEPAQGVSNSFYQDLLRYYFLDNFDMKEVLEIIGVDELDDNFDSKMRLLYARRYEALKKFIKCQKYLNS